MDKIMLVRGFKWMVLVALCAGISACGQRGERSSLINLRQSAIAPDEFLVVPQKPLETPSDLSSLPTPVPGEKLTVIVIPGVLSACPKRGKRRVFMIRCFWILSRSWPVSELWA